MPNGKMPLQGPVGSPALYQEQPRGEKLPITAFLISFAIVIIITLVVFAVWPRSTDCGTDRACFLEEANKCDKATMEEPLEPGTTISYSTDGCVLVTTILVESDQPSETIDYIGNKAMECGYTRGSLDDSVFDFPPASLEDCEGELKDIILSVQAATILAEAS